MPGLRPFFFSIAANHRTSGVLPVPPATRLPTTITATGSFAAGKAPLRYANRRNATKSR